MIFDTLNDKYYVGKAVDLEIRWRRGHLKNAKGKRPRCYIDRAIRKYESQNFVLIPYEKWNSEVEALIQEILLIKTLRTLGKTLYNVTDGGEGISGYKYTPEQREKCRQAAIRRWQDPETRKKMIDGHRGKRNITPQTRAKWSKDAKQRWLDPEMRRKNITGLIAAQNRPETKARKSASMKIAANKPEFKKRYCKPIRQIDLRSNKTIATYQSLGEAATAVNGDAGFISRRCHLNKTAYGFRWQFITRTNQTPSN